MTTSTELRQDLRMEKVARMNELAVAACRHWEAGDYDSSMHAGQKLSGFSDAFQGIDSDLFWYGCYVYRRYAEFMVSDVQDFTAWVVGHACTALRAAA